jgi:mycothiol synthase
VADVLVRRARLEDLPGIRAIQEACLATDGIPGFTRIDIDRSLSRIEPDLDGTVVAILEGTVAGACTPRHDDLTVHPAFRRRGAGRALATEAMEIVRERGQPWLQLYVPPHLPASEAFARAIGLAYHSSLWLCELAPEVPVEPPAFSTGFVTRSFEPGEPLEPYVALMNETFGDHPTPVSWDLAVVRHVHALDDFDPAGILLVAPVDDPDRPVAYTKVEVGPDDAGVIEGWIAQIGVLPAWRGRGLGRELLRWGVAYTRARGAGRVELAVEGLNETALGLYRRNGFVPTIEWPHWIRRT